MLHLTYLPINKKYFQQVINVGVEAMKCESTVKLFELQYFEQFLIANIKAVAQRSMKDNLGLMALEGDRVVSVILAVDSREGPVIAEECISDVRVDQWSRLANDTFKYAPKAEIYVYIVFIGSIPEYRGFGYQSILFETLIKTARKKGYRRLHTNMTSSAMAKGIVRRGGIINHNKYKLSNFKFNGEKPYETSNLVVNIFYCDIDKMKLLLNRPIIQRAKL